MAKGLVVQILGDASKLKEAFADAERASSGFASKIGKAGLAAGAVAGAAIAGAAVKGVTEFASFEKGMNEVFTLLPDISGSAMAEMQKQVLEVSKEMGVLPETVIPSLYSALSAGVPTDNVFAFLKDATKLSTAGVAEMDETVSALTGVLNAYTDGSVSSAQAADLMFNTVKNGVTTIPELASSLGEVTPIAAALGLSFDQVSAAFATSTKVTQNTSKTATGLKGLLAELGKSGTIASKNFEKAAGTGFQDFLEQGGNLADALALMSKHADANGLSMIDMFGSIEAGQEALRLAANGGAELRAQLENMGEAAGSVEGAYATMDKGLARSWEKIKARGTAALIQIGQAVAPLAEKVLDLVVALAEKLSPVISGIGQLLGPVIASITSFVQGISGGFDSVSGKASEWQATFSRVFGAVKDVVELAKKVWERVMNAFRGEGSATASWLKDVWGSIVDIVKSAAEIVSVTIKRLVAVATWIWDNFGGTITAVFKTVWENVKAIISAAFKIISGILDIFVGIFTGDWKRAWEGVKKIFSAVWNVIKTLFQGIVRNFVAFGKDILAGILKGLGNIGQSIYNKLKGGIDWAIGKAKDFLGIGSPSKVMAAVIGEPMAQGVALGIERQASLIAGALNSAVPSQVDGPAVSAAGARGAAASGPVTINIVNPRMADDPMQGVRRALAFAGLQGAVA